jgi:hypothetical protein
MPQSWDEMLKAAARSVSVPSKGNDQPPPHEFGQAVLGRFVSWSRRNWSRLDTALGLSLFVLIVAFTFYLSTSQPATPTPPKPVLHTTELAVGTGGDMSFVLATVNGLEMPFLIDSGSTTVCLPDAFIGNLRRQGLLTDADVTGSQDAELADGRVVRSKTYNLARVRIGTWNLDNVSASSCRKSKVALLGQAVLGRFVSWSLDNRRHVLVLTSWVNASGTGSR